MKFSKYVSLQQEAHKATIGGLLAEIDKLREEIARLKRPKKALIVRKPVVGFDTSNPPPAKE